MLRLLRRMPFLKVLAIAQTLLLARRHLLRLDSGDRRRLRELARRGRSLSAAERDELRRLLSKLEPRGLRDGHRRRLLAGAAPALAGRAPGALSHSERVTARDIETRADCERLVRAFYGRAFEDPIIGFLFTDVAKLDLEAHVPRITSFWETILLGAQSYGGGAFRPHAALHAKAPLRARALRPVGEPVVEHGRRAVRRRARRAGEGACRTRGSRLPSAAAAARQRGRPRRHPASRPWTVISEA